MAVRSTGNGLGTGFLCTYKLSCTYIYVVIIIIFILFEGGRVVVSPGDDRGQQAGSGLGAM
jgi:hypothetical protein